MAVEFLVEWKMVGGFEDYYMISSLGIIKSLHKKNVGKVIKARIDRANYFTIRLSKNGETHTKFLHRLLAEHFIPNPEEKKYVNHINGDKLDDRLCNLEWSTHSENIKHAYRLGLINTTQKEIPVIDICTNRKFPSIRKAATFYEIPYSTCKNYLNGNRINNTPLLMLV